MFKTVIDQPISDIGWPPLTIDDPNPRLEKLFTTGNRFDVDESTDRPILETFSVPLGRLGLENLASSILSFSREFR
jgi:hypothetical protein